MRKPNKLCKICRREGEKLFLKGERCLSSKCSFIRRSYPPGQHGARYRKVSDYAKQLREKQKAKRIYGVLERQFKNYYQKAAAAQGDTAEVFLSLLERRLDNVVYRLGLVDSRGTAKQLISHGHFLVNDRKVNIPSYLVKPNDVIRINPKSATLPPFQKQEGRSEIEVPSWLQFDSKKKIGRVLHLPTKDEVQTNVDFSQIIEFYSR